VRFSVRVAGPAERYLSRLSEPTHGRVLARLDQIAEGANVDWDLLVSGESWLSTTEKAVVRIAHGCAILERHGGGLPLELRWQVRATVTSTTE
jgi:hypothetical protein